jgi:hypothetical protein
LSTGITHRNQQHQYRDGERAQSVAVHSAPESDSVTVLIGSLCFHGDLFVIVGCGDGLSWARRDL